MKQKLTTGSVFDDLELDPGKAEVLKIKAALFDAIITYIKDNDLTQEQATEIMGVQRSRIDDVCRGKISGFSIDTLVAMAARTGLRPLSIPERLGDLAVRLFAPAYGGAKLELPVRKINEPIEFSK